MSIKNMKIAPSLPSAFARQVAVGVDLLPVDYNALNIDDYEVDKNRLAQFQQLAVAGSFEDALLAYYGIKLDKDQLAALRVIYNTTKPWLLGHVVGEMLTRLEAMTTDSEEALKITQFIVERFAGESSADPEQKRGLLLRFASGNMSVEMSDAQN